MTQYTGKSDWWERQTPFVLTTEAVIGCDLKGQQGESSNHNSG